MTQKTLRNSFILLFILGSFGQAKSQNYPYWEFGAFGGFSNYIGDLSTGLNNFNTWRNAGGLVTKVHLDQTNVIRGGVTVGKLSAEDGVADRYWKRNRNLNFRTNVVEIHVVSEVHLFTGPQFNRGFHPYLYAGLAGFHFNPQTRYFNEWIDLQPLGTEGQETALPNRSKYSLYSIALPVGIGWDIDLGNNFSMGLEFGFRWTLTDFLDDVSGYYADPDIMESAYGEESINVILADRRIEKESYPSGSFYPYQYRGDPRNKDRYVFFGVNITKKFRGLQCNSF